jgi:cell division protein FtsA
LLEIVDQVLRKPGRIAAPQPIAKLPAQLAEPEFATSIGLLLYGYRSRKTRGAHEQGSLTARLKALFARGRA